MRPPRLKQLVLIPCALVLLLLLLSVFQPSRFEITPRYANIDVSVTCSVGTNHVCFWGDNSLDPFIKRFTEKDAYRLRYASPQTRTVLWVRILVRRDRGTPGGNIGPQIFTLPEGGYAGLRARLETPDGRAKYLMPTHRNQWFRRSSSMSGEVEGWILDDDLPRHRGDVVFIETPDGTTLVSIQVK